MKNIQSNRMTKQQQIALSDGARSAQDVFQQDSVSVMFVNQLFGARESVRWAIGFVWFLAIMTCGLSADFTRWPELFLFGSALSVVALVLGEMFLLGKLTSKEILVVLQHPCSSKEAQDILTERLTQTGALRRIDVVRFARANQLHLLRAQEESNWSVIKEKMSRA
jgi:hypothetical protein